MMFIATIWRNWWTSFWAVLRPRRRRRPGALWGFPFQIYGELRGYSNIAAVSE
jgi:hypothetical protein